MTNGPERLQPPESWRMAITGFLEYKRACGCGTATIDTRYRQLRRFANDVGTAPEAVVVDQLTGALARCRCQETRRGLRNCLVTFFAWLQASGRRGDNPAALLPNVRGSQPHPKPCPDEFITDALRHATPAERVMLRLASECGLRRGEMAAVHASDVLGDVHGRHSLIVHGKGNKQRVVPLPDDLAESIAGTDGFMFPGRFGGHVEASYISKHISRLLPDGYGAHKLRHRFATTAYGDTHDLLAVSRALGHSSTEVTQRYVALPDDSLRPLVQAARMDAPDMEPASNTGAAKSSTQRAKRTQRTPRTREHAAIQQAYAKTIRTQPQAVRHAAACLMLQVRDLLQTGQTRSFVLHLTQFAAYPFHGIDDMGNGRIEVVRRAAGLVEALGIIELRTVDDDTLGGNVIAPADTIGKTLRRCKQASI